MARLLSRCCMLLVTGFLALMPMAAWAQDKQADIGAAPKAPEANLYIPLMIVIALALITCGAGLLGTGAQQREPER